MNIFISYKEERAKDYITNETKNTFTKAPPSLSFKFPLSSQIDPAITYSENLSILKNTYCQPTALFGVDFPLIFSQNITTVCAVPPEQQPLVYLAARVGEQPDSSCPTGAIWLSPPTWTGTHMLPTGLGIHLSSSTARLRFQAADTAWFTETIFL